jgi:hypothetical protein
MQKKIAVLLAGIAAAMMLLTGFVRIDHFGGTYGISAGTDMSYCSLELGHLPTCEHVQ